MTKALQTVGLCLRFGTALLASMTGVARAGDAGPSCISIVGDVSVSRGVATELHRTRQRPFTDLGSRPQELRIGNLEGALLAPAMEQSRCQNRSGICLPMLAADLANLRGEFSGLSLANNHSDDFGDRDGTARALKELGITPILEAKDPTLFAHQGKTWALVPVNLINRPAEELAAVLADLRLRVGLARAHTPLVIVLPHWGREYDPRPDLLQEDLAERLLRWGALLIAGSHAHVIQPHRCTPQGAIYFGLGNHLFDGPESTWEGINVRCCRDDKSLRCATLHTHRTAGSTFPKQGPTDRERAIENAACAVPVPPAGDVTAWQRHRLKHTFDFVQPFPSLGPGHFFALHRSYSAFDKETALRPVVFRISGNKSQDLWRGTALSRPLIWARLFKWEEKELLCALHRGDSFLQRDPKTTKRVHLVYRWNGFGFGGFDDPRALEACRRF